MGNLSKINSLELKKFKFYDTPINRTNKRIVNAVLFLKKFTSGALGQTRTGTPKRARILSPLCLPISPRGHILSSFCVLYLTLIYNLFFFKSLHENYATDNTKQITDYQLITIKSVSIFCK